jgi:WD40 repeat protein
VAISPDGASVAAGGHTGHAKQGGHKIYVYDRESGEIRHVIGDLPNVTTHLKFSPDGRYLAAMLGESSGLQVYETTDFKRIAEDRDYRTGSFWADFDAAGRLVTACGDGHIRLYGNDFRLIQKKPAPGGKVPYSAAFSHDGRQVAVGYADSRRVDVLSAETLGLRFSADTAGMYNGSLPTIAWSQDGRFLYAAGRYAKEGFNPIRRWSEAGRGGFTELKLAQSTVTGLKPLSNGELAVGTTDPLLAVMTADGKLLWQQRGVSADFRDQLEGHPLRLSPNGDTVQFGYEQGGKRQARFSLNAWQLELDPAADSRLAGPRTYAPGLLITDWRWAFDPKLNGTSLALSPSERVCSLAVAPDMKRFLLGTYWSLRLFDSTGTPLWDVAAPAVAWAVNISGDGRLAVAGFGDGTLRWYRMADGKELLALFPHRDGKHWVAWTPQGFCQASAGAEDLIGWHLNQGGRKAPDFYGASRFRSTYYRPDVINRVLASMDEALALQQANEEAGRKQAAEISVREKLPPVAVILSPADGSAVSGTPVTMRYSVRSPEPLTGLKVLVDGRPVAAGGIDTAPKESGELSVPIPSRDCDVSVIAENRHAAGELATIRLRWKGAAAREEFEIKPKLYVLAVGVSMYQDPEMRLNLAAKDALDFGAAWNDQRGRLYSGVEVRTLTDAQATKGNILDGLDWLQRQVTAKDVAMLFFAGHGVNDSTGAFYFLPLDADLEKLKRTGISQADITSTVAVIAGKVLVFVDACHSGNLMGKLKRRGVVVVSSVINELASAENGAVVFSSATGRQYALENAEWGNGAFTKGLVEGIRGKADFTSTGRITVNMLDLYVSERVKELTKGQQTPTTVKPPNVPDFPVALVR